MMKETAGSEFNIFMMTETNLDESIADSEILTSDYLVFRNDRNVDNNLLNKKSGGGVLIAVDRQMSCRKINTPGYDMLEMIVVEIKSQTQKVFLVCIYIPPNSLTEIYEHHVKFLDELCATSAAEDLILCYGDYNLPRLRWVEDKDENFMYSDNATSSAEICVNDGMLSNGLNQINRFSNSNNRMLDLVFTNNSQTIKIEKAEPIFKNEQHHEAISITVTINSDKKVQKGFKNFLNYKKSNFVTLNDELSNVDWSNVLSQSKKDFVSLNEASLNAKLFEWFPYLDSPQILNEVDEKTWIFAAIICSAIIRATPAAKVKIGSSFPPWFDKELTKLCIKKNELHKRVKKDSLKSKLEFEEARKEFKSLNRICYKLYIENLTDSIKENPKSFFEFVNLKKKCNKFPSRMTFNGLPLNGSKAIAEGFADFFKTVYNPASQGCFEEPPANSGLDITKISFTDADIMEGLSKMDGSKGPGPDGIPPKLLKQIASSISAPLKIVFNLSLEKGVFPSAWKISHIAPIFKKGDRNAIENYRSVSIQNSLAKLFDMMVFDKIRPVMNHNLTQLQHGFTQKRSSNTNLILHTTNLINALEKGEEVDSINTDFTKAFDKVSHRLLIEKLSRIGFGGPMLEWFASYLKGRSQFVLFDNERSGKFETTSGVPAGTHGGPDLFLVMISDLPEVLLYSEISLYADDCKFSKIIRNANDSSLLQSDVTKFQQWCENNELLVNPGKCSAITFTKRRNTEARFYQLGESKLATVTSVRDLGVELSNDLNFNQHVANITSKASRVLGFVRRFSRDFRDHSVLKVLYCALVRPHLEYCSIVWSPHSTEAIERIEKVQRKFTKIACKKMVPQREFEYSERLQYLGLQTLEERRKVAGNMFVAGVLSNAIDCPEFLNQLNFNAPNRYARTTSLIREPTNRTDYGRNNPLSRLIRNFNDVQEKYDFHLSRNNFRHKML